MKRFVFLGAGLLTLLAFGLSHGQDKVKNDPKKDQGKKTKKAKAPVAIGTKMKDLRFKDIRYLPRSIKEIGSRKAYVIVASTVSCPINGRYWPKLKALHKEYKGKGVEFLALNVEARDSIKDMATQAVEYGVPFHFVKDTTGRCIRKLGLTTTAQVVILDSKRVLRYRGRVDDQYRFNGSRPKATRHDLKNALDQLLAGKDITVKETPVDGCRIQFQKEKYTGSEKITYARHIAPMMQKHCQDCHRPGGLAPFDLMSYDDVATNASMISEVVAERRMPPWYASEKSKGFHNYRGMNSEERAQLIHWAKNGTPRGNAKNEPKPRQFPKTKKWEIGVPDMTIRVPQVVKLPADGYVNYKYFFIPGQFPHDRWIEAIQIRPDNTRVLHHCNMLYTIIDENGKRQDTNFVTGVVPGSGASFTQKGTAFKIPKGATLILQAHYTTTGKEETDQLTIGFKFARNIVNKELRSVRASNRRFKIPAGATHHRVRGGAKLPGNVQAIALFSHMHLRGKAMIFNAIYPDGKKEEILTVPNYSFDWQQSYKWKLGTKTFPKGTRIQAIGIYDNSKFNPFNPDATKDISYGLQTYHEMMFGFFFFVLEDENLQLKVDPKTGKALGQVKEAIKPTPTPEPKKRKKKFFSLTPR